MDFTTKYIDGCKLETKKDIFFSYLMPNSGVGTLTGNVSDVWILIF